MMLFLAIGMVFIAWIVVGGACTGWGAQLLTLLTRGRAHDSSLPARFWAGFAMLLGLLQIWHLFLPVDWRATLMLLGSGWLALWRTGTWAACRTACRPRGVGLTLLVFSVWLAYRGLDYPRNFDSGLYHFASVRWANEFPAVPGLANLHDRFGFNQSLFLYVALLNVHPLTNEGYHAANNLLFLVLVAQLLDRIARLRGTRPMMSGWVAVVMLPVAISRAASGDLSSPTPDLAVFAVGVAAFMMALRAMEENDADFAALPALLAAGCTLKLSFAVFAFSFSLGLILGVRAQPASKERRWWWFGSCALAWGLPYAIHGVILSGYPAFPATYLAWPVDWRLPVDDARSAANWVLAWARAPGRPPEEVLNSWQWFAPWWQRVKTETAIPVALLLSIGAALVLCGAKIRRVPGLPVRRQFVGLFLPLLVSLTFWFCTAPDPRFGDWLIWLTTAWLAAAALNCLQPRLPPSLPRLLGPASMAAALIFAFLAPGLVHQPRRFGWRSFHRVEVRTYETLSVLRILVPAPNTDTRLWDAPPPASPYEKPNLELRGAGLREGFRTRTP